MKFWQLLSVCNPGHRRFLIVEKAQGNERWHQFGEWHANLEELVRAQDRAKLDYQLPDEYVEAVLGDLGRVFYLSPNGRWLRSMRMESEDQEISPVQAFRQYGADAVEEASEKGVATVALERA